MGLFQQPARMESTESGISEFWTRTLKSEFLHA
jgi:hypothetical protein